MQQFGTDKKKGPHPAKETAPETQNLLARSTSLDAMIG
jgi:hypothetical protein